MLSPPDGGPKYRRNLNLQKTIPVERRYQGPTLNCRNKIAYTTALDI